MPINPHIKSVESERLTSRTIECVPPLHMKEEPATIGSAKQHVFHLQCMQYMSNQSSGLAGMGTSE